MSYFTRRALIKSGTAAAAVPSPALLFSNGQRPGHSGALETGEGRAAVNAAWKYLCSRRTTPSSS